MALESKLHSGDDSNQVHYQQQNDPHFDKVRKVLEPLENRWKYVQDVVLWKQPFNSLCYLAGINCVFGYLTTDTLRHICIVLTVLSLTLCIGEVRGRVRPILEKGGIGKPAEGKSPDNTVPFYGLCQKLAALWSFGALYSTKLLKLKTDSSVKFFGVIFIAFVAFSFAYQYLPWAALTYFIVSMLYLWPGIRYYGIHYKVRDLVRPFYAPITTQWEHSRTKRERKKIFKAKKGEVLSDSDDDFTNELNPKETVAYEDITSSKTDEMTVVTAPAILSQGVEDKHVVLNQQVSDDSSSEPRMVESLRSSDESLLSIHTQGSQSSQDSQWLEGSIASPNSSMMFVEGMSFPSMSQGAQSIDLDDRDFMRGLEFPDIEDGYNSSTESLHMIGTEKSKKIDKDKVDQSRQSGKVSLQSQASSDQEIKGRNTQLQCRNIISSSSRSSFSDEFEVLETSEAEGLEMREDRETEPQNLLGSAMASYLGKWLGYNK